MNEYSASELFELLNQQDECDWIEAKGGHENSHSLMETVCSFSNEPGLGGGFILLGVAEEKSASIPQYKSVHIADPDKFQRDFVSQCSSMFNIPIRPKVSVERIHGDTVLKIRVEELAVSQKPIYFKSDGLPRGAYRRIGSTDQRCNEDDLRVFFTDSNGYDQSPVLGSSISDIDDLAIKKYRSLREKINPNAEELTYDDFELLESLGCINKLNKSELNLACLILFGSAKALRSFYPMLRIDYIRVPGTSWVEDPDNRFTTIDMRGPLLTVIFRLMDAINADLPKGFLLEEGFIQASSSGLPSKVLREALVNAMMHRSYREHRPTQVIRYDNRIEIVNPGYSLKSEERFGDPGSETRNPFVASVFHETNLAETKGSGIRAMRKLMRQAHLSPPTFESDRSSNQFVSRLLLHHFLDEKDLAWLKQFEDLALTDGQKQALIFVREVGAIDNQTYRQMTDCDTIKASNELKILKSFDLFHPKGKGKATYYIAGKRLDIAGESLSTAPENLSASLLDLSTPPLNLSALPQELITPPQEMESSFLVIAEKIAGLNKREHDSMKIKGIIMELCAIKPMKASEIAGYFKKGEAYIKRKYLSEMIKGKQLIYLHQEMLHHPEQAYLTTKSN
jgi:ATP-dependent DNA helicase RecG